MDSSNLNKNAFVQGHRQRFRTWKNKIPVKCESNSRGHDYHCNVLLCLRAHIFFTALYWLFPTLLCIPLIFPISFFRKCLDGQVVTKLHFPSIKKKKKKLYTYLFFKHRCSNTSKANNSYLTWSSYYKMYSRNLVKIVYISEKIIIQTVWNVCRPPPL